MADSLAAVAAAMVPAGRGLLAADEDPATLQNRFDPIGLEASVENGRIYRELLFTTPGIEAHISGVILFDDTLRQSTFDGTAFPDYLAGRGMAPGIKVDLEPVDLPGFPGEFVTEGLDGLPRRLEETRELGACFAKWRAAIAVGAGIPTRVCIDANAHALARYAACCQAHGLVPIVEPEVVMDGSHTIEDCEVHTTETRARVMAHLHEHQVAMDGIVLKPSMVLSGKSCPAQATADAVAAATRRCFSERVPAAVSGIAFLSGGQSPLQATANLDAINRLGPHPWQMSFSYGRALQAPVLDAWQGRENFREAAQAAFLHRARCNGAAALGRYAEEIEGGS